MQAVESEAQSLKAELGLEPELAQVEEAPRFSKRARQMEPETELGLAAAVHLSKAHAAHLRSGTPNHLCIIKHALSTMCYSHIKA